nr:MAG TPA: hypothetical protein [Herelleviridae sp.]
MVTGSSRSSKTFNFAVNLSYILYTSTVYRRNYTQKRNFHYFHYFVSQLLLKNIVDLCHKDKVQ